jgi:hypothetical protein
MRCDLLYMLRCVSTFRLSLIKEYILPENKHSITNKLYRSIVGSRVSLFTLYHTMAVSVDLILELS